MYHLNISGHKTHGWEGVVPRPVTTGVQPHMHQANLPNTYDYWVSETLPLRINTQSILRFMSLS